MFVYLLFAIQFISTGGALVRCPLYGITLTPFRGYLKVIFYLFEVIS